MSFLDTLATPAAFVLNGIHEGLSTFLPENSGWTWSLSVVFLTITVRLLIFPLFVKQIKSQRRMMVIAPRMKELQAKHKGDRDTLNTELMKLYKETGTNPVSGCMPMLLQMPVFFAMFRLMNQLKPNPAGDFEAKFGLPLDTIKHAARADFLGAPIASAFNSPPHFLEAFGASSVTVKIVTTAMILTMGLTTFLTQKQMMARNGPVTDPQQAQIQKLMLYVLPLSFAVFGFTFPVGLLLYQLVTNFWSMGQQHYIIRRMPPTPTGTSKPGAPVKDKGTKPQASKALPGAATGLMEPEEAATASARAAANPPAQRSPQGPKGPPGKAQAGSRKNKNKKRKRR